MGEANYYAKLIFESEEEAKNALEEFKALCIDICKSEDYWQSNRGFVSSVKPIVEMTDEKFWDGFEKSYPLATNYLKSLEYGRHGEVSPWGNDRNNGLAGLLEPIGRIDDVENIHVRGNEIRWSSEVWHFADWDPFIKYCQHYLKGCEGGGWLSDEYVEVDYYEMI